MSKHAAFDRTHDADPWPEIVVADWPTFVTLASRFVDKRPRQPRYAMRGQADKKWRLIPSLLRPLVSSISGEEARAVEHLAVSEFQAQAHNYLANQDLPLPTDRLPHWWAVMQHYGAPTRLMDWTYSPYVAVYYACLDLRDDGAIYVVDRSLAKKDASEFQDSQLEGGITSGDLVFWEPPRSTERMAAQQGLFTFCPSILGLHDQLLANICRPQDARETAPAWERWIVPKDKKVEFLRFLRVMNISARTLFPGIDGLGRSVGELALLGGRSVIGGMRQIIERKIKPLGSENVGRRG